MKTLNLDNLSKVTRNLILNGVTYEVQEMTVENFIETTKAADALLEKKNITIEEQMEASIGLIKRSIPNIEEEVLRKMTLEQLGTLSKFLRGELDDEGAEEHPAPKAVKKSGQKRASTQ